MGYQGVTLLIAAVIGIGFAAYQYYTQQNTAQSHEHQRSHTYTYVPTTEVLTENNQKRRSSISGKKCSICQETLRGLIRNLVCKHSFHKKCIDQWFKQSRTCPLCRTAA